MTMILTKLKEKKKSYGIFGLLIFLFQWVIKKVFSLIRLFIPPILNVLFKRLFVASNRSLAILPDQFKDLPRAQHALYKLLCDYEFQTVLDVGAGGGEHARVLDEYGKEVWALDFGTSVYAQKNIASRKEVHNIYADFYEVQFDHQFDCIWASHVLEHQPNPGLFIQRCIELTKDGGVMAITVPPLKNEIVGGHLTLWNAGLLLYQLVFNGVDCSDASILTHDYNVTVIVKNIKRAEVQLTYDQGDLDLLSNYFPDFVSEPFDGRLQKYNW